MEREAHIEKLVDNYLEEFKISIKSRSDPRLYEKLITIEKYFQKYVKSQIYHFEELKKAKKININSLSKHTRLSRSSIYNSPNILQRYIENRIITINKNNVSGIENESSSKTRKYIKQLETINAGLQQEIADNYGNRLYIEKLESEIEILQERRETDVEYIKNLESKLKSLNSELKNYKRKHIIKFDKD